LRRDREKKRFWTEYNLFYLNKYKVFITIKIYKTVILQVVLYGCETWSLTLGEEHRLRVFENRVLRKMDHGKKCIMMSFMTCILRCILLGWLNQGEWGGLDMWDTGGMGEVFTGFWLRGPKARDHCEDLSVGGMITLKWTLGRKGSMGRTGFGWLRIGSSGGLLWTWWWTFGFHKKVGYFLTS
jgi:hypothetical protein